MRRTTFPLQVVLCALLCATQGWARPASPAKTAAARAQSPEKLIREGERLYQSGRYHDAAEVLIRAYAAEPNVLLLYNVARASDQAGELDRALEYYQRYVGSAEGTDPTLLKRSALAIERIRGLIQQRQASEAERQRLAEEKQRAEESARAEAEARDRARREAEAQERALELTRREGYQNAKTGAFVVGGIGAAAVINGAVWGVLALQTRQERLNAPLDQKASLYSTLSTQALIADVSYGVGAAALITAIVLYPKGPPPGAPAVSVVPTRGGVSASLEVAW